MKPLRNKNIFTLLLIASAIFFMGGCKSKKIVTSGGTLKSKAHTEVVDDALLSQLHYKTISTKGSIEFALGNSSKKSSAVYKIIKDSLLQASIRPLLGMEAFRITFTPDSVIILDRLKKQYITESIKDSKLMANFDFNFYNLQAMLTNQLYIPGRKEISPADYNNFNITSTNEAYVLQTKDKAGISYGFNIDASDRIVSTLIYNQKKNISLQWSYADFIKDEKYVYPTTMNAVAEVSKKRVNITIIYNKLDIDKNVDIDISIPSKYEKVEFSKLMDSYIKIK